MALVSLRRGGCGAAVVVFLQGHRNSQYEYPSNSLAKSSGDESASQHQSCQCIWVRAKWSL